MLARPCHCRLASGSVMNNQNGPTTPEGNALASEYVKRITQLGLSKRQVAIRTGLARQTLNNIENGRTDLRPATFKALDEVLLWRAGTAMALAAGDLSALDDADVANAVERESAYRWQVVERIGKMSLNDLERLVSILESEELFDGPKTDSNDYETRLRALERMVKA